MNSTRLYFYHFLSALIPPTRLFVEKRALLRWAGAEAGKNFRVASSARFHLAGKLTIGENSWIGHGVLIAGGKSSVCIGKNVDIAPRVSIITGSHNPHSSPDKAAGDGYSLPINISDGVWIGTTSTILGGVELESQCIIAAGALVRRSVPSKQIVAGVPARPLNKKQ